MEFKIHVVPKYLDKGELILESETPLSGVQFMTAVGSALRRNIDFVSRARHITLGALSAYDISVPQSMAISSGHFEYTDQIVVKVSKNLMAKFIFYVASVTYAKSARPCYPYTNDEAALTSMIDELSFLDTWAYLGYPLGLMEDENGNIIADPDPDGTGDADSNTGNGNGNGLGCEGCPCTPGGTHVPPPWSPDAGRPMEPPHPHYPPHHGARPPQVEDDNRYGDGYPDFPNCPPSPGPMPDFHHDHDHLHHHYHPEENPEEGCHDHPHDYYRPPHYVAHPTFGNVTAY